MALSEHEGGDDERPDSIEAGDWWKRLFINVTFKAVTATTITTLQRLRPGQAASAIKVLMHLLLSHHVRKQMKIIITYRNDSQGTSKPIYRREKNEKSAEKTRNIDSMQR